jgi:2-iminoacetate synthase
MKTKNIGRWHADRIKSDQVARFLKDGRDFIDDDRIEAQLRDYAAPEPARVRDILRKSLAIQSLTPEETATLLQVADPELLAEMEDAAGRIKRHVYDNRIVTFAPLYLSNECVNNCSYCGLRSENRAIRRRTLTMPEVRHEVEALAGEIGHKRLIVVYGEHAVSDLDYMVESIQTIYDVNVPTARNPKARGRIRRVNVNAAPLSIEELAVLKATGLGTYQVFQETYHHKTYAAVHPAGTLKADYRWRLYAMHRAMAADIDDAGIGALFGLYDWRFEVMGLVYHARALEQDCGIGPHTISFPRLEPAENTPFAAQPRYRVNDAEFRRALTVIRLAVPYTGMILTARESAELRRSLLPLGVTQMDASTRIGVGAYADGAAYGEQQGDRQQFLLGDPRSLDDVVRELAERGLITSFCTAGYRCGRTGKCIMDLLRSGQEGKFCKLNAVLTFREWLDDFATPATKALGERVIEREIGEVRVRNPKVFEAFYQNYQRVCAGERDLYF